MSAPTVTVVTRRGCHLCEDFILDLEDWARSRPLAIDMLDADSDPALAARYGERVPVLLSGTTEVCSGRLDSDALGAALDDLAR